MIHEGCGRIKSQEYALEVTWKKEKRTEHSKAMSGKRRGNLCVCLWPEDSCAQSQCSSR